MKIYRAQTPQNLVFTKYLQKFIKTSTLLGSSLVSSDKIFLLPSCSNIDRGSMRIPKLRTVKIPSLVLFPCTYIHNAQAKGIQYKSMVTPVLKGDFTTMGDACLFVRYTDINF